MDANDSLAHFILPSIYGPVVSPTCTDQARYTRLTVPKRALRAAYTRKTPAQALRDSAAYQDKCMDANDSLAHFVLPSIYGPIVTPTCTDQARYTRLTVPKRALRAAYTRKTPAQALRDSAAYQGKCTGANDSLAHFNLRIPLFVSFLYG